MADSTPFKCDLCPSKFTQKGGLKQHYINVHKLNRGQIEATTYSALSDLKKSLPKKVCPHCGNSISHNNFSAHLKTCNSKPATIALGEPAAKESRSERARRREVDEEFIPGSPTKNESFSSRVDLVEDFRAWLVQQALGRHVIGLYISILQKVVLSFTGRSICNRSNVAKGFRLLSDHIKATENDHGMRKEFLRSEYQVKRALLCNQKLSTFFKENFGEDISVFETIQAEESFDQTLDESDAGMEIDPEFESLIQQPILNQQPEPVVIPQQQNLPVEEVLQSVQPPQPSTSSGVKVLKEQQPILNQQPEPLVIPQQQNLPVEEVLQSVQPPQPSTSSGVKIKGDVNFTENDLRVIFLEFENDIIRQQHQVLVRCMDEGDLGFFLFCEKKCREEKITTDELAKAIFKVLKEQNKRTPKESLDAYYSRKLLEHGESDEGLPLKSKYFNGKGYGIVATARIAKGSFVCEYVGELLSPEEADEREEAYEARGDVHSSYMYYFRSGERTHCIDATVDNGRYGRLINHSKSNANLTTRKIVINNVPRLFFIAKCDIPARKELLYPYGDNRPDILRQHQWLKK